MLKMSPFTVSLAAAKLRSARSASRRAMMPAVTAPTASTSSRQAAPTARLSARRCWRTSCESKILLGHAVDGGGKVGAEIEEARIARIGAVAIGAEVDPFRLGGKASLQNFGQRCLGRPFEVALLAVPIERAGGHADQQRVGALMGEPIFDLLADPRRGGGFRRGQQQQIAGLRQRLLDRRPELRRGRQRRVVAKHAQAATPIPRLAELLDHRLQRRSDRLVLGVAVGNERVVDRHDASPARDANSRARAPRGPCPAHGRAARFAADLAESLIP